MNSCNFIDPSAVVSDTARVWHYAVVLAGVVLADGVSVGSHAEIGKGSIIGAGTRIGKGVFLPSNTVLEGNVFVGPGTVFCDDKYPRAGNTGYEALPPRVCRGAVVGAGCVILPGITIGPGAFVGAGSVVTEDVPSGATVYGDAARLRSISSQDDLETAYSEV